MANVFPRARLRLIWIGWKSAARRGKPRQSMNHRAPGAVGISCFLTPSVRAVPYGPNASVANGGAALTSNPKNDCNNRPAPIIKPRLDNRAYANASSSNMGLPAWCDWRLVKADNLGNPKHDFK